MAERKYLITSGIAAIALIAIAVCLTYLIPQRTSAPENVSPTIEKLPVTDESGVTLDLSSPNDQMYRTNLTEAFWRTADFNGHYVVAIIGCGTGCFSYAVIDKQTGKIYHPPASNDLGAFTGDIGRPYTLESNEMKIVTKNGSTIETYAFTGTDFTLVSSDKIVK